VARDPKRLLHWLTKAAGQGVAAAQNNLGYLAATGYGVEGDLIEAHKWFSLAAIAGHPKARGNQDAIAKPLSDGDIAEARKRALAWLDEQRRAARRAKAREKAKAKSPAAETPEVAKPPAK